MAMRIQNVSTAEVLAYAYTALYIDQYKYYILTNPTVASTVIRLLLPDVATAEPSLLFPGAEITERVKFAIPIKCIPALFRRARHDRRSPEGCASPLGAA